MGDGDDKPKHGVNCEVDIAVLQTKMDSMGKQFTDFMSTYRDDMQDLKEALKDVNGNCKAETDWQTTHMLKQNERFEAVEKDLSVIKNTFATGDKVKDRWIPAICGLVGAIIGAAAGIGGSLILYYRP